MTDDGQGGGHGTGVPGRDDDPWSDLPQLTGVTVPDDPRDLDEDVRVWRREMSERARQQLRRQRLARWRGSPGQLRRWGMSVPMLVSIAVAVALVSLFTLALGPHRTPLAAAGQLATGVPADGRVGSLLPAVNLTTVTGVAVPAQVLRPAVLLLVPDPCDATCTTTVGELVAEARSLEVQSAVVVGKAAPPDTPERVGTAAGQTPVLVDGVGLADRLAPTGVTAVMVGRDGVVADIARSVQPGQRLEPRIRPVSPAAS